MIEDFINYTQPRCKELILKYQVDLDPGIFRILLAKYDRYILKVIYDYKKKYQFLSAESMQELYHTGIIGFSKCLVSFTSSIKPHNICPHIRSYVISEIKQHYFKKDGAVKAENIVRDQVGERSLVDSSLDEMLSRISIEMILEHKKLTRKEKRLIKLRYIKQYTIIDVAKKTKIHHTTVMQQLKKIIQKIRKLIKSDLI
jgi:RNA polymerase sigma factor (sigma-70 family)